MGKEICYSVALDNFNVSKEKIQAATTLKYRDLLKRHGKTDVNLAASLASLVTDIFDTFGIEYDPSEFKNGLAAKNNEKSQQEKIPDQSVQVLEKKVEEMEKKLRLQRQADSWKVLEDRMVQAYNKDGWISPAYVPSVTFDQPSAGIVVPPGLEGDERIAWLMENDHVFRRGRLAWLRKQENFARNLEQREKNKARRKQQQENSGEKPGRARNNQSTSSTQSRPTSSHRNHSSHSSHQPQQQQQAPRNKSRNNYKDKSKDERGGGGY